jgi:hypothetical protein
MNGELTRRQAWFFSQAVWHRRQMHRAMENEDLDTFRWHQLQRSWYAQQLRKEMRSDHPRGRSQEGHRQVVKNLRTATLVSQAGAEWDGQSLS